jgi:hypothetical protein
MFFAGLGCRAIIRRWLSIRISMVQLAVSMKRERYCVVFLQGTVVFCFHLGIAVSSRYLLIMDTHSSILECIISAYQHDSTV